MTTDSMFKILRGNHEESGLCNACHRPMIPVIYKGKPTISGHVVIVYFYEVCLGTCGFTKYALLYLIMHMWGM